MQAVVLIPMKLQVKILLFLVPAIVTAMLTLGWVAYTQLRDFSEQKTFHQMTLLLDQIQQHTASHLAIAKSNAELLASSDLLKHYLQNADETNGYFVRHESLQTLFDSYQKAFPEYYEIRLILPELHETIGSTATVPLDAQGMEAVNAHASTLKQDRTQDQNDLYVTVFSNSSTHKAALVIAKRIYMPSSAQDAELLASTLQGYLVITTSLDFLDKQIQQNQLGKTGYLLVTDQQGAVLFHPDPNQRHQVLAPQVLEGLQADRTTTPMLKTNFGGEAVYVRALPLQAGLLLLAVLPEAEFLLSSRDLAVSVATVICAAVLITTILLFLILRALVIKPINSLGQAAEAIGSGQFPLRLNIRRTDEIGHLAHAFKNMSEKLQHSSAQIRHLAYHDSLTGLPNRRMFLDYVERALSYARRHNKSFALLFLDLDNFKQVNDTLGHDAGDQLLREVAERLTTCIRAEDYIARGETDVGNTVARLGGDEFIILIPNISSSYQAAKVAERIVNALLKPIFLRQKAFYVGTSIGITVYPDDGADVDSLVKNADIAMYRAKQQGKGNYQHYTESMHQQMLEQLNLEQALRKAVECKEFVLHYQPQIDVHTCEVVGVEALLRWQHPTKGLLAPDEFIDLAKQTGLIEPIGEWVLEQVCRQAKDWRDLGFVAIQVAVNIARCQFHKGNLKEFVQQMLTEVDLAGQHLNFELTETSVIDAQASALKTLTGLKNLGVNIALDKFGSGYSSLSALRSLPIDAVKIDRHFIHGSDKSEDDAAIVKTIIAMSRNLNLQVIAEGVETQEQFDFLRNNGCTKVQGYFISQPLAVDAMTAFMLKSVDFPGQYFWAVSPKSGDEQHAQGKQLPVYQQDIIEVQRDH